MRREREQDVQGVDEAQQARLKQQRQERKRAEQAELKRKYMPLLKFMKSNGLKFKTAAVKKKSVEYFRMDQFRAFLEAKTEKIQQNKEVAVLLKSWQAIFAYYQRPPNQPHLKWPQQLQPASETATAKFASFRFDSSESSKYSTALIVGAVLGLVLFPLWPFELKYLLWKVSLWLLVGFCAIIAVRLVVYLLLGVFGVSFWLFPRFFENNVNTIDSFLPVYSVQRWEGSNVQAIVTRLLLLSLFVYYGYHIYSDPGMLRENLQITQTIIDDLDSWGVSKIKGEKNFSQSALTDYSRMFNQTFGQDAPQEESMEV